MRGDAYALPARPAADPIMMPRIQVDKGAIKFILGGANVMCAGITSKGGALPAAEA